MKRKGFTLIELLAVIVILAVIGLITIPLIGNIIEDSKKKALETSVNGIVEAANYFTISNDGIYEFLFNTNKKGETKEGNYALDYKGQVDAEGSLYVDNDGNISLCLMNDNYYVYKNYNSGVYIGNISDDTCIIGYDALTNKYVAMLDDGTGQVSNVYSREAVDTLVTNLQNQITSNDKDIESLNTLVNTNAIDIVNLQTNVDELNNNLANLFNVDSEGNPISIPAGMTTSTSVLTIWESLDVNSFWQGFFGTSSSRQFGIIGRSSSVNRGFALVMAMHTSRIYYYRIESGAITGRYIVGLTLDE